LVVESGNSFLRTLVGRGALTGGAVSYSASENPTTSLANGQLTLDVQIMPPPLEQLDFNVALNQNYLSNLGATQPPPAASPGV
jgi:phage tail sheath protein FI